MIKTLRASGAQLKAEVAVGANKYGSDVTVTVNLARRDPGVEEALAPLLALLTDKASEQINSAAAEKQVRERVAEEVKRQVAPAKERAEAQGRYLIGQLLERYERYLGPSGSELQSWQLDKLREFTKSLRAFPDAPSASVQSKAG